jgi:hypothetical protein
MPEVDSCDATSKRSTVKAARGRNSALRFGPHPSHAESGTAGHRKAEKLLHAIEVLIATLSDRREILYRGQVGNGGGANDCSRAARSYGAAIGDGLLGELPAEAYHPGTAVADHRDIEEAVTRVHSTHAGRLAIVDDGSSIADFGPTDLQMSIEGLL